MLRRIVTAGLLMHSLQGASLFGLVAALGAGISGCATLERLPAVTYAQAKQADILDIPDARFYVAETQQILEIAVKGCGIHARRQSQCLNGKEAAVSG